MLGVVASVVAVVWKTDATTPNNTQQLKLTQQHATGCETDATYNIQQRCVRLCVALHSVDTVLLFKQNLAFRSYKKDDEHKREQSGKSGSESLVSLIEETSL